MPLRRLLLPVLLFTAAASAAGQSAAMKPFELNMDRVKAASGSAFAGSKTYFIPAWDLIISVHGSVWAQKGGAQAHGKYFVEGLGVSYLRGLATKAQNDLVAKMRAAGFTVLTYDDLKDDPAVKGRGLDKADDDWKFPIKRGQPAYAIVAPSEGQQFNNPIQGPVWSFRGLAKEKQVVVIVPEVTYATPLMWGVTRAGYSTNEAGIATDPAMKLMGAVIYAMNPKQSTGNIIVQEHGTRLASENAGTITKLTENKTEFSREWQRSSGDYSMMINTDAFADGILRVAFAINDAIVAQVKKESK